MQLDLTPRLILIHGLHSTPQEFGLMAHMLRSRGIAYEAIEIPGYTHSALPLSRTWLSWIASAVEAVAAKLDSNQPVVLAGLCTGGILAAALTLGQRFSVHGLVLMSPTFVYDGWGLSPWRRLRKLSYLTGLDRFFSVRERDPFGVKNPKIRRWIEKDLAERAESAVGPSRLSLRSVREAESLTAWVRSQLHRLDVPTMIMHAREDEITRLSSIESIFESMPPAHSELVVLEDSYHMVTIDNDRHRVVKELHRFMKAIPSAYPITLAAA